MFPFYDSTPFSYLLGYFHQDYRDVTGDEVETVAAFLLDNPELAQVVADEIRALLATGPTEDDLWAFATPAGCDIDPRYVGETYRDWFTSIEAQARAYAAEHPQA